MMYDLGTMDLIGGVKVWFLAACAAFLFGRPREIAIVCVIVVLCFLLWK